MDTIEYLFAVVGLLAALIAYLIWSVPQFDFKNYGKLDNWPTWLQLVHIIACGGFCKKCTANWEKNVERLGVEIELTIEQKDVDEYVLGLQLPAEQQSPAMPAGVVPVGLIMTLGPRLAYSIITQQADFQHLFAVGLINTGQSFQVNRPVKIGEKMKVTGKGSYSYVKKGLLITASGTMSDEAGVACEFRATFLKMMKHKQPVPPPAKRRNFDDATAVSEATWEVPGDQTSKWLGISGDPNPIHVHKYLAMLFGQKSNIMHGTWLFAKSFTPFEATMASQPCKGEIKFIAPLNLPGAAEHKVFKTEDPNTQEVVLFVGKGKKRRPGSIGSFTKLQTQEL